MSVTPKRIVSLFGGDIQTLKPGRASSRVKAVNQLLLRSYNRPSNRRGKPGGIAFIPDHLAPVIVGDLHARVDNLLMILCADDLLQKLEAGVAALIILGDAIHNEEPPELAAMDSSLLMMDLIFALMLRYPRQVTYLTGNHDGFSEEIIKDGVPQGVLWAKHLSATRGEFYLEQMRQFYQLSPLLAQSKYFLACHAGPPRERVSSQMIINVADYPRIANDLAWNRVRSALCPAGYTGGDVRRFRKCMGADPTTPLIVGHSPLSDGATVWENIGNIPNHHLVYSAQKDQVGLFTRSGEGMQSRVYTTEPLRARTQSLSANPETHVARIL